MIEKVKKAKSIVERWVNRVYPMPSHFGDEKLKQRTKYKPDYKKLANSISKNIDFRSMIDIGCAQGFLMELFLERNIKVKGIEVSEDAIKFAPKRLKSHIEVGDFSQASGSYDLVCCVEVAEHIDPARSQELVNKLCSLSEHYIYFTAAPPGQDGRGHINCRPHEKWMKWFNESKYFVNQSVTDKIKSDLEDVEYAEWLQGNSLLFQEMDK